MSIHASPTQGTPAASGRTSDEFVAVEADRADWLIHPRWRDVVLDVNAPHWFALEDDERAACVKEGEGRKVWRIDTGGGPLYAKVFDNTGRWSGIKARLLGDAARRELTRAHEAARRGVRVVSFIGTGKQRCAPGRSVLLSEEVSEAVPLTAAWRETAERLDGAARLRAVKRLSDSVARLYAAAHERGFVNSDGHPDNILVFGDPSEPLQAVFVDLHAAKLTAPPVPQPDVAKALGQLEHVFCRVASRSERSRFLRRYAELRGWTSSTAQYHRCLRALIPEVRAARKRQARQLARKRDRRLRRNGKYFATFELAGGWRATVNLAIERRHLFAEVAIPDRSEADWRGLLGELIDGRTVPDDVPDCAADAIRCFVHRPPNAAARIAWTLSSSPARAAFEHCHRLRHRDVPAPLVLGFVEHHSGGLIDLAIEVHPRDPFLAELADAPTDPRFAPKPGKAVYGDGT